MANHSLGAWNGSGAATRSLGWREALCNTGLCLSGLTLGRKMRIHFGEEEGFHLNCFFGGMTLEGSLLWHFEPKNHFKQNDRGKYVISRYKIIISRYIQKTINIK